MTGWRSLVDGFREAISASTDGRRPAPTAPFGDVDGPPRLPGLGEQDPVVRDIMLARLRRRDPEFDTDAFVRGAVAAFSAVEQAWTDMDPQRSRRYLSAPLWCSHRARMELYALHGRRNHLDGLTVRGASIAGVETGDGPDRITVRIAAQSTDYDTDGTGAIVRGDRTPFDWKEDWVLQRDGSATTRGAGGVLAQSCPSCGAPLDVDEGGCCTTCQAPVMDGSRDWVVVAVQRCDEEQRRLEAVLGVRTLTHDDERGRPVTQTAVVALDGVTGPGAPEASSDPATLAVLTAADPGFVASELCDHARTAFTAVRKAWGTMDADAARPYLSEPAYWTLHQAIADTAARGLHRVTDDPLVDAVLITRASDADGLLTAVCAVTAELIDADADAGGVLVRGGNDLLHAACALTFRRHDIARSPAADVSVLRCPRCGAPLRATVLEPCPYCKQAVADGGGSWALTDIGPLSPAPVAAVAAGPPATAAEAPIAGLVAADPSINVYDVVAAAREAFFAVEASTARLNASAAAQFLTPAALAAQTDRLGRLRAAGHSVRQGFLDLTAAAVTAGAVVGDGSMRVTVRFEVSGDVEEVDASGAAVAGPGRVTSWREDWDLVRAAPGTPWLVDAMRLPDGQRSNPAV